MAITNTKIVRNRIERHIRDHGYGIRDLKRESEHLKKYDRYVNNDYQVGLKLVDGGAFDVYYSQVKDTLNKEFKINPENKEYSDDKSWNMYRHLIAREIDKMLNKPRKKRR